MSLTEKEAQDLRKFAETLERVARQLRDLADGADLSPKRKSEPVSDDLIPKLKEMERMAATQLLASLPRTQLGRVFVSLGGSSRDMKRNKDWLVERILWYLFDFQAGHEIIRGLEKP